ncbi:patatin family protein [Heterostelium album PN500]|uniref:Patatin family protein n=1 Tax=Heterostelium pallidum (strain ATCC 26659 / Pp 5 / PN500) TaxID=670386 RepID=D3BTU8_HETP5|nr:patatin family protein [Heterostelium album PN500]EFA75134.1 patatin family protein [Heterostelium album PN500]|eukprot:XP_020427268.1 patatin family protein [Heterostelium album PN500]
MVVIIVCCYTEGSEDESLDANVAELKAECNNKVYEFCCEEDAFYCKEHSEMLHAYDVMKDHDRVPIDLYKCATKTLDETSGTPDDFKNDWNKNNILYVSPNTQKMEMGMKWLNTGIDEKDPFLLVSFVGPAGAGKSTLIRSFAEGQIPVSSNSQTTAASSDINCYNGTFDNENHCKYLLFDSEGKGADTINQMIINTQSSGLSSSNNSISYDYRRSFIDTCYPRLLYLFSDVFVYVFNQTAKQKENVISELLSYAAESAAASVNQLTKPHLIVAFNKSNDVPTYDNDEARELIFHDKDDGSAHSQNIKELKKYYQSLNVIFIPPGKTINPDSNEIQWVLGKFVQQTLKLKTLVYSLLQSAYKVKTNQNIVCERGKIMGYISKAINILNRDPHGPIDIYKMARSMEGVNSFLFEYFECIYNLNIKQGINRSVAFDQAFQVIITRVKDILYLYCQRNSLLHPTKGQHIPQSLIEMFEKAHSSIMKLLPCNSAHPLKPHIRCEVLQGAHGVISDHKSTQIETKKKKFLFLKLGEKVETVSYQWIGNGFEPSKHYQNLAEIANELLPEAGKQHPDENITIQNRLKLIENKSLPFTNRVCYGCLLDHPTQTRKCGHMFCITCSTQWSVHCPVCGTHSPWTNNDIPTLAGTRILSLEGIGGVTGVAQAFIITTIEHILFDIRIHKLVDLIIGSGSGGLVALGVTGDSGNATRMIAFYTALKEKLETYPLGTIAGIKNLTRILYRSIYKKISFQSILKQHLEYLESVGNNPRSDQSLLCQAATKGNSHVAVTSTTKSTGSKKLSLFTSYHLPGKYDNPSGTVFDACLSTSATDGFIEPHIINEVSYTDGSTSALAPAIIGYEEAQRLFNRSCDLIVAVTTGKWANPGNQHQEDCYKDGTNTVSTLNESSTKWAELKDKVVASNHPTVCRRIDPEYTDDYCYDEKHKIESIISDVRRYCEKHKSLLNDVATKLLASQFYLTVNPHQDSIKFTIQCRLSYELYENTVLVDKLRKLSTPFSITADGVGATDIVFDKVQFNGGFSQSLTINNLQRDKLSKIDIKLNIVFGDDQSEDKKHSISGFPMNFSQILNTVNKN